MSPTAGWGVSDAAIDAVIEAAAARIAAEAAAPGCLPSCWQPVRCPSCGNDLPPRGRSVPQEAGIPDCCDRARMDPAINPRHLWRKDEEQ